MAEAVWNGFLRVSLVSCPVHLSPATTGGDRVRLDQINARTGNPVARQFVDSKTGDVVAADAVVKGYQVAESRYVIISDDEMKGLTSGPANVIDIEQFVPRDQVNRLYFEAACYIYPEGQLASDTVHALRLAMERNGRIGLGRVALGERERAVLIEPHGFGLMMSTLRSLDEVEPPTFAERSDDQVPSEMVEIAESIITRRASNFDPAMLRDRAEDRLRALVEEKSRATTPPTPAPEPLPMPAPPPAPEPPPAVAAPPPPPAPDPEPPEPEPAALEPTPVVVEAAPEPIEPEPEPPAPEPAPLAAEAAPPPPEPEPMAAPPEPAPPEPAPPAANDVTPPAAEPRPGPRRTTAQVVTVAPPPEITAAPEPPPPPEPTPPPPAPIAVAEPVPPSARNGADVVGLARAEPALAIEPRELGTEVLLHILGLGDRRYVEPGWAGHPGSRRQIEALSIRPREELPPSAVEFRVFAQEGRATAWVTNGNYAGTRGRGLPLTGFAVRPAPELRDRLEIVYEGCFFEGGVVGPKRDGELCVSPVADDPLEAVRVSIVERPGG